VKCSWHGNCTERRNVRQSWVLLTLFCICRSLEGRIRWWCDRYATAHEFPTWDPSSACTRIKLDRSTRRVQTPAYRQPLIRSIWGPLACLFPDCCRTNDAAFSIANSAMVKFLPKILDPDPDPVYRQNLIVSSLAHVLPFHDFFSKIGRVVLRNPVYKQTNKRTKEQKPTPMKT